MKTQPWRELVNLPGLEGQDGFGAIMFQFGVPLSVEATLRYRRLPRIGSDHWLKFCCSPELYEMGERKSAVAMM